MTATATATATEQVRISQLNEGDVVWAHGLRLLLGPITTADPNRWPDAPTSGPTRWSTGRVLNPEVFDDPASRATFRGLVDFDNPTWKVQSNDLAVWVREVPEPAAEWDAEQHTRHENSLHYGILDARTLRRLLADAGLGHLVERVTASRHLTFVRLAWSEVADDTDAAEHAHQVADAIQAAYAEHGRRAATSVTWKGGLSCHRYARAAN